MNTLQHLLYDGSPFARPCDGQRNIATAPVPVVPGSDAALSIAFLAAATFRRIPVTEIASGVAAWRFCVADGLDRTKPMLYATDAVSADIAADTLDIDLAEAWTEQMRGAIGDRPKAVFIAELAGYASAEDAGAATSPVFAVTFPFCAANRRDDGAETTPLRDLSIEAHNASATAHPSIRNELDAKATKADATINSRGYSDWTVLRNGVDVTAQIGGQPEWYDDEGWYVEGAIVEGDTGAEFTDGGEDAVLLSWTAADDQSAEVIYTATRSALPGYVLGNQTDKPVAAVGDIPAPATAQDAPQMDGTPSPGSSATYARSDHVHPRDTAKANLVNGTVPLSELPTYPASKVYVLGAEAPLDQLFPNDVTSINKLVASNALPLVVTGDVDLSTMAVSNLSHTFAEAAAAVAERRDAYIKLMASATPLIFLVARLVLFVDSETIYANTFLYSDLGDGYGTYAIDIEWSPSLFDVYLHRLAYDSELPSSETWTFTVDDGQGGTETVTKSVAVYS